jgi:hypothetical protein
LGRKQALSLGLVTNVVDGKIYTMPQEIEHKDFVPALIGATKEMLVENPSLAERIIPSIVEFGYDDELNLEIVGLLTGVSGMEIGFRVRHTRADLEFAHRLVLEYLREGEFHISSKFQAAINYKYAKQ